MSFRENLKKCRVLKSFFECASGLKCISICIREETLMVKIRERDFKAYHAQKIYILNSLRCYYREWGLKQEGIYFKSIHPILLKETLRGPSYLETASGDFVNHCSNPSLYTIFEQLREVIKSQNVNRNLES